MVMMLSISVIRNRYPAVASYVLNVTTVPFEIEFTQDLSYYKDLGCFVINLLNNKTIICSISRNIV